MKPENGPGIDLDNEARPDLFRQYGIAPYRQARPPRGSYRLTVDALVCVAECRAECRRRQRNLLSVRPDSIGWNRLMFDGAECCHDFQPYRTAECSGPCDPCGACGGTGSMDVRCCSGSGGTCPCGGFDLDDCNQCDQDGAGLCAACLALLEEGKLTCDSRQ